MEHKVGKAEIITYQIGRKPQASPNIIVPDLFKTVHGIHAEITISPSKISIKDVSNTGTFVNGDRIVSKTLNATDKIMLGAIQGGYEIDLAEIITAYNTHINKHRTDFSEEFTQLLTLYDEYFKKREKIKRAGKIKIAIPRIILSLLLILIVLLLGEMISATGRYILMGCMPILAILLSVFSPEDKATQTKLHELDEDFQQIWVCPKCRKPLPIDDRGIVRLKRNMRCTHQSCNAIYKS